MVPFPFLLYCLLKGIKHVNPQHLFRRTQHITAHVTTESLYIEVYLQKSSSLQIDVKKVNICI